MKKLCFLLILLPATAGASSVINPGSSSSSGGVTISSTNTWTGSQTFTSSITIVAPNPVNWVGVDATNTTGEFEFFQSGVKDHTLIFSGNNATLANDNLVLTSGNLSVAGSLTLNSAVNSVAPGFSSANTLAGILELTSAAGNPNFISFNEQGIANRGSLGYLGGSSTLIYQPGVEILGNGTTRVSIDTVGNITSASVLVSSGIFSGMTFAQLGGAAAPNGSFTYCSDCAVTTPATCTGALSASCVCTNGGTGEFAKRLNATWYCN